MRCCVMPLEPLRQIVVLPLQLGIFSSYAFLCDLLTDLSVCVDSTRSAYTSYMQAVGAQGIPTAFVINKV